MQAKQIRQLAADFGLYCGTAEDVQELESRSFEAKSNLRMFAITSDEPINEDFVS